MLFPLILWISNKRTATAGAPAPAVSPRYLVFHQTMFQNLKNSKFLSRNGVLLTLSACNIALVFLRSWHIKQVDEGIEDRVRIEVERVVVAKLDNWCRVADSNICNFANSAVPISGAVVEKKDTPKQVNVCWSWLRVGDDYFAMDDNKTILGVGDITEFGKIKFINQRIAQTDSYTLVFSQSRSVRDE